MSMYCIRKFIHVNLLSIEKLFCDVKRFQTANTCWKFLYIFVTLYSFYSNTAREKRVARQVLRMRKIINLEHFTWRVCVRAQNAFVAVKYDEQLSHRGW